MQKKDDGITRLINPTTTDFTAQTFRVAISPPAPKNFFFSTTTKHKEPLTVLYLYEICIRQSETVTHMISEPRCCSRERCTYDQPQVGFYGDPKGRDFKKGGEGGGGGVVYDNYEDPRSVKKKTPPIFHMFLMVIRYLLTFLHLRSKLGFNPFPTHSTSHGDGMAGPARRNWEKIVKFMFSTGVFSVNPSPTTPPLSRLYSIERRRSKLYFQQVLYL